MSLPFIFSLIAAVVSTTCGGLVALRYKDKIHLILGFTAGVLLSVVAFDLLPEIFSLTKELAVDAILPMIFLVIGFLLFHIAEKLLLIHHTHEDQYGEHKHPNVGVLSALALAGHSFLDGVGIGIGFHISATLGAVIAFAVVAHDFSDGLNTVSLMLAHKNTDRRSLWLLSVDALAPVVGGFSTFFFTISAGQTLMYLGFFAGFLLYIGASDILPEAHSQNSSWKTIVATLVGVIFM
ncbi:MAG: ZIP family metal transporter, partial [Candidatus Pacebacteria bacterium]|nr:ZIP family metal transporter [Candidatus Paceibacterota bacterium]